MDYPWVAPSNSWSVGGDASMDLSNHPLFFQSSFFAYSNSGCSGTSRHIGGNIPETWQEWVDLRDSRWVYGQKGQCFVFNYTGRFQIRYVMIKDAFFSQPSDWNHRFIEINNVHVLNLDGRPGTTSSTSRRRLHQNLRIDIKLNPSGTCTTGNVLVRLYPNRSELLADGDTSAPTAFSIPLINCPHVNIGYSFVAPVGIGFDNATGVVDLDSTPNNAEGVGIQIRHRNDPVYGNNTIVFNPSDYTNNPSYTRNWPQCQSQGTCTNNQQTGVNHTIPMQATVYRKGNVTPGRINSSLLVHIVYP